MYVHRDCQGPCGRTLTAGGAAKHRAHGLCSACYTRSRRAASTRFITPCPDRCTRCDRKVRPRQHPEKPGEVYGGLGMCKRCYDKSKRPSTSGKRPSLNTLEDYEFLQADGLPKRAIAERLGLLPGSLDTAIIRGRKQRAERVGRRAHLHIVASSGDTDELEGRLAA